MVRADSAYYNHNVVAAARRPAPTSPSPRG